MPSPISMRSFGPRRFVPTTMFESIVRVCAIALLLASGLVVAACQTPVMPPPPPPPRMADVPPPPPPPPRVLRTDQPGYYRLRNTPAGEVPVRVALLLPFTANSQEVRNLAQALQRAAELALFDSGNKSIILMPRDDGGTPEGAQLAAAKAIEDGAEVILGPLFAQSVMAVGPIARGKEVPVIAFSSDRSAGGRGVYLLSFQPETEVRRIVGYAASQGHNAFAALVPRSAYGDVVSDAFRAAVSAARREIAAIELFEERPDSVAVPAASVAQSGADAVLIGEGGTMLQAVGAALSGNSGNRPIKYLGTGLWADASLQRDPMLANSWFAAPPPEAFRDFSIRYRRVYGAVPPRIATLAYDAMSLIALLANGTPYDRFTEATLTDPSGFTGIDGLFRFRDDGAAERGLAVLQVAPNGFTVVDPAPKAFPAAGF
jgi:branched-chain amino acid transport system substrate-binding protein